LEGEASTAATGELREGLDSYFYGLKIRLADDPNIQVDMEDFPELIISNSDFGFKYASLF